MSLPQVTNLVQTAQDSTGTTFAWDAVALADSYAVYVDGSLVTSVTTPSCKVTAGVGNHTVGVVPVALATAPTKLAFTVPPPPPPPPTGLTAVAASATRVNLAWNAVTGATLYDVYRNGVKVFSTAALTLSDGTVEASTTYGYQVDAVVGGLTSVLSTPIVSVTTPAQGTVPPPPTGLALALGGTQSNPTVVLTWDTSAGATSYDIYRNGVLLKNVP